jgi:hypothetical protein
VSLPDLDRQQATVVNAALSSARDAIYRAAESLALDDDARSVLWEMAGHVEDAKVLLLRRCEPCRKSQGEAR